MVLQLVESPRGPVDIVEPHPTFWESAGVEDSVHESEDKGDNSTNPDDEDDVEGSIEPSTMNGSDTNTATTTATAEPIIDLSPMLDSLQTKNSSEEERALTVLGRILINLERYPAESRYRRLRRVNERLCTALTNLVGGPDLLNAVGFYEEGDYWVISEAAAGKAGDCLESLKKWTQAKEEERYRIRRDERIQQERLKEKATPDHFGRASKRTQQQDAYRQQLLAKIEADRREREADARCSVPPSLHKKKDSIDDYETRLYIHASPAKVSDPPITPQIVKVSTPKKFKSGPSAVRTLAEEDDTEKRKKRVLVVSALGGSPTLSPITITPAPMPEVKTVSLPGAVVPICPASLASSQGTIATSLAASQVTGTMAPSTMATSTMATSTMATSTMAASLASSQATGTMTASLASSQATGTMTASLVGSQTPGTMPPLPAAAVSSGGNPTPTVITTLHTTTTSNKPRTTTVVRRLAGNSHPLSLDTSSFLSNTPSLIRTTTTTTTHHNPSPRATSFVPLATERLVRKPSLANSNTLPPFIGRTNRSVVLPLSSPLSSPLTTTTTALQPRRYSAAAPVYYNVQERPTNRMTPTLPPTHEEGAPLILRHSTASTFQVDSGTLSRMSFGR